MARRGDVDKLVEAARQPLQQAHLLLTMPYGPERQVSADEKRQLELQLMLALERTQEALSLTKDGAVREQRARRGR